MKKQCLVNTIQIPSIIFLLIIAYKSPVTTGRFSNTLIYVTKDACNAWVNASDRGIFYSKYGLKV